MKTLLLLCTIFILPGWGVAQSFLNGGFENNSATGCNYNLSDDNFNLLIEDVTAFGMELNLGGYVGECDLQTFGCYLDPAEGSWCVGLATEFTEGTGDAIALALTTPLTVGETYEITMQAYGNTEFTSGNSIFEIGETTSDTSFGNLIFINQTIEDVWHEYVFTFTATVPATHIAVRVFADQDAWMQVDDFTISRANAVRSVIGAEAGIRLFPNPASDRIQLELEPAFSEGKISIFDERAQLLYQNDLVGLPQLEINIEHWPPGVFYLTFENRFQAHTIPFVKQ